MEDKKIQEEEKKGETFYRAHPIAEPMGTTAGVGRAISYAIESLIWWVAIILEFFMALRLGLAMFGADGGNLATNLAYSISEPLVSPFFSLFSTSMTVTAPRIELETIVAMVVYYIVAYIIVQLMEIFREER